MNSSVKITISLISFATLGAVGFACTVGSSTDPNTTGGTSTSSGAVGTSTSSSGSTGTDAGDAGTAAAQCPAFTRTDVTFESDDCTNCLLDNCCAETAGCYNTKTDGTKGDCVDYSTCLGHDCDDDANETDKDNCKGGTQLTSCRALTFKEIPGSYNNWLACQTTQCSTKCGVYPDGGAKPL